MLQTRRKPTRWERPSKSVLSVEAEMKNGAILHRMHIENGKDWWWLEGKRKRRIHASTATKAIAMDDIIAMNDGLFPGTDQSWVHRSALREALFNHSKEEAA
jgi:hypothetical protein